MLRRLIVAGLAFLIASGAGVTLLLLAALNDPAIRETGLIAAMNGVFYLLDNEAITVGDTPYIIAAVLFSALTIAIDVCVAPLAFAVALGAAMGLREFAWYSGVSGVLAGASPWIARAAMGLDKARESNAIETRIALLFFLTGAFTGALYWMIAVPKTPANGD